MMFFDTAIPYQINLQDSATYGMEMIVQLHNYVMFINVFIISVVVWFFFEIIAITGFLRWFSYRVFIINLKKVCVSQLIYKQINNSMLHMSTLEIVWTLLPVLALITIALPSLSMLYYFSMSFSPAVIVNVIGHQWFWSYEYHYSSEITDHQIYSNAILRSPIFDTDNLFDNKAESILSGLSEEGLEALAFKYNIVDILELNEDDADAVLYGIDEFILTKHGMIEQTDILNFAMFEQLNYNFTDEEIAKLFLYREESPVTDTLLNDTDFLSSIFGRESFNELFNVYCKDLNLISDELYNSPDYQLFDLSQTEDLINNFIRIAGVTHEFYCCEDSKSFLLNGLLDLDIDDFLEDEIFGIYDYDFSLFDEMFSSTSLSNVDEISLKSDINSLSFNNDNVEKFDSIMTQVEDLAYGSFRLLEVDKPLYLPVDVPIRVIVSSDDVLHSWAVPSLGVKIDCVPGRLNVVEFRIARQGVFYGQCSEICGTQHGFMPICIVTMPRKLFYFV